MTPDRYPVKPSHDKGTCNRQALWVRFSRSGCAVPGRWAVRSSDEPLHKPRNDRSLPLIERKRVAKRARSPGYLPFCGN